MIEKLPVEWDKMNRVIDAAIAKAKKDYADKEIVWIALGAGGGYTVERMARNERDASIPDATRFKAGQNGIPLLNMKTNSVKHDFVNSTAQDLVDLFKATGADADISSKAGRFLCESATYHIEVLKERGVIASGFFMHIPTTNYNGSKAVPQITNMSTALLKYLGPDGDPDGDGIPNKNDRDPFVPEPS